VQRLPSNIDEVVRDPAWLAHRYDPGHDAFHFRLTPRDVHRSVTFITEELLPPAGDPIILRRQEVMAVRRAEAPLHFIFHSAYCCSTMLARAFDLDGFAMGLKEPVVLNDLVGWRRRGAPPRQVAEVLGHSLDLMARPFENGEAVIVKPSNVVNGLAEAMLAMRPQSRALFLYAPLPTYLRSIARKDMWGRLWVRELLIGLLKDGLVDLGFSDEQYLGLTDLQVGAVGWLAQHALFARLVGRLGRDRVATLDSQQLLADSVAVVTALVDHFGLEARPGTIERIVTGPGFTSHSKSQAAFTAEQREAEQRDAAIVHGDEIAKVEHWAQAVAANAGLSFELGARLIA
jgi:hypothetical protein